MQYFSIKSRETTRPLLYILLSCILTVLDVSNNVKNPDKYVPLFQVMMRFIWSLVAKTFQGNIR